MPQEITFNQDYTSLLNELKDLTPEKLDSGIEALRLDSKVLGLEKKVLEIHFTFAASTVLFSIL